MKRRWKWGQWKERYFSYFIKGSPNECWNWKPELKNVPNRYGLIKVNGKSIRPHRVGWMLAFGDIPEGMEVCHKCDNPRCQNPNHLFIGTHAQNMRDAAIKKRITPNRGSKHKLSKLREEYIPIIRHRYKSGESAKALAIEYGVAHSTLWSAAIGKHWNHIL